MFFKDKPKETKALEYKGKLYHSLEELQKSLASNVIYNGYCGGAWAVDPRRIYEELKEIYNDC